jgi:hypothetical protein
MISEFADFIAKGPAADEILKWRPSQEVIKRISRLLEKQDDDRLTLQERQELDNCMQAELMLRALKARLMTRVAKRA